MLFWREPVVQEDRRLEEWKAGVVEVEREEEEEEEEDGNEAGSGEVALL